jgi:hypothetical protein
MPLEDAETKGTDLIEGHRGADRRRDMPLKQCRRVDPDERPQMID